MKSKRPVSLLRSLTEAPVRLEDLGVGRKWLWAPRSKVTRIKACSPTTEYSSTED